MGKGSKEIRNDRTVSMECVMKSNTLVAHRQPKIAAVVAKHRALGWRAMMMTTAPLITSICQRTAKYNCSGVYYLIANQKKAHTGNTGGHACTHQEHCDGHAGAHREHCDGHASTHLEDCDGHAGTHKGRL